MGGLVNGELPFPFYYANHPVNQVGYLGRAFNDHVRAEGRGPRLFALTADAEIEPAAFTGVGRTTTRTCERSCEVVLRRRDPKAVAPCFVRLRASSEGRVKATVLAVGRAFIKPGAPVGADASGTPLSQWTIGPVVLDAERPDATLQTWALDADEVRVKLTGPGRFSVTAGLGTVALTG